MSEFKDTCKTCDTCRERNHNYYRNNIDKVKAYQSKYQEEYITCPVCNYDI